MGPCVSGTEKHRSCPARTGSMVRTGMPSQRIRPIRFLSFFTEVLESPRVWRSIVWTGIPSSFWGTRYSINRPPFGSDCIAAPTAFTRNKSKPFSLYCFFMKRQRGFMFFKIIIMDLALTPSKSAVIMRTGKAFVSF